MKPNRTRLIKLIEAVNDTPMKLFNMEFWACKTECGTVGCAVGRYILANPKCGLRLYWLCGGEGGAGVRRKHQYGMNAVASHFQIDICQADRLFCSSYYKNPTKANVLRRFRSFVAANCGEKSK